ncbi:MAG TPA: hypothetical protein VGQ99_06600 [Tepidisphaeraceae bacterium]|jgi:hypothetical protein|nr:hypothetical protein [Tepidisphaeraceae bacterium]
MPHHRVSGLLAVIWAVLLSHDSLAQQPLKLTIEPQDTSVYALPTPATTDEGANTGGVNVEMRVNYLGDYLYRGVDRTTFIDTSTGGTTANERANFQFDGKLMWNLGKLPHPFIGIFANVLDQDPISTFQEVRPVFGAEWRIRPLILSAGHNTYIFPDRSELNTGEVWGRIALDDSVLLRSDEPFLTPYIYAAYDYDIYNGWYFQAGVTHEFVIEGTGITFTAEAAVGGVIGHQAFAGPGPNRDDTGLQHYEFGLTGRYNLNQLLNIAPRFGQWSINGYLYYSDGISNQLSADTQLWGGMGIQFSY